MAYSNIPLLTGATLCQDSAMGATAETMKASSAVLYELELDNTANGAASYFKIWNTGAPTVGTTAPDMVVMAPASTKITLVFPSGITFATALTIAAVTTAGTAGVTAPTSAFAIKMVFV